MSTAAIKREQDAFSEETALAEARAAEERRRAEQARQAQEAEARKQAIQDELNAALTEEIPFIKVRQHDMQIVAQTNLRSLGMCKHFLCASESPPYVSFVAGCCAGRINQ